MSNGLYNFGREGFLDGSIDWDTDTICVGFYAPSILYSGGHTEANSKFWDELGANDAIYRMVGNPLTGKTVTKGVADADDLVIPASTFSAGFTVGEMVIAKYTGIVSVSRLIAHFDIGLGFPWALNAGIFTIVWPNSATKIFKL